LKVVHVNRRPFRGDRAELAEIATGSAASLRLGGRGSVVRPSLSTKITSRFVCEEKNTGARRSRLPLAKTEMASGGPTETFAVWDRRSFIFGKLRHDFKRQNHRLAAPGVVFKKPDATDGSLRWPAKTNCFCEPRATSFFRPASRGYSQLATLRRDRPLRWHARPRGSRNVIAKHSAGRSCESRREIHEPKLVKAAGRSAGWRKTLTTEPDGNLDTPGSAPRTAQISTVPGPATEGLRMPFWPRPVGPARERNAQLDHILRTRVPSSMVTKSGRRLRPGMICRIRART